MKRAFLFIMAVFISFTSSAQANVGEGLRKAFEEYHYSMTVEWDQKDLAFKKAQEESFSKRLEELKNQGMNQEDVYVFFQSYPQTQLFGENLRGVLSSQMSSDELLKYYNEVSSKSFSSGASWVGNIDGGTIVFISVGALMLTALGLWAFKVVDCKNERYCFGNGFDCESKVVCE